MCAVMQYEYLSVSIMIYVHDLFLIACDLYLLADCYIRLFKVIISFIKF